MAGETIWAQCFMWLVHLKELQGKQGEQVDFAEIDRLAIMVTKELTYDVMLKLGMITQDPKNGFDDEIPF